MKPWNYLKSPTVLKYGLTLSLIGGLASSLSFNPDSQIIARNDLMQNEHTIGLATETPPATSGLASKDVKNLGGGNGAYSTANSNAAVSATAADSAAAPAAATTPAPTTTPAVTPDPNSNQDVYVSTTTGGTFCVTCLNKSIQDLRAQLTDQISQLVTALTPAKAAATTTADDKTKKHDHDKASEKYADFSDSVKTLSRGCDDDAKDLKKSSSRLYSRDSSSLDSVDLSSIQSCASDNLSDLLQKCEDDETETQNQIATAKDDKDTNAKTTAEGIRKGHAKICSDEIKHLILDVTLPAIKVGFNQLSTSEGHKTASQMAADLLGKLSDYLNSDADGLKHIVASLALQANREIDQEAAASDRTAAQLIYNKDIQAAQQQCQIQGQMSGYGTSQVQAACNSVQTIAAINKAASQDTLNQLGAFANAEGMSLRGFAQQIGAGTSDASVMSAFAQNYYSPIQSLLNSLIAGSNGQQVNGLAALGTLQPGQAALPGQNPNNPGLGTNAAAARIFTSNQAIPLFNATGTSLLNSTDPNLSMNAAGFNNNLFSNTFNVNSTVSNNGSVALPTLNNAAGANMQVRSAGGTGGTISIH